MFVPNHDGNVLINTAHITTVHLVPPCLERKEYWVVANLTHGDAILHKGTKESCQDYMWDFASEN